MRRRSSIDQLLDSLFRPPHDYRAATNLFPDLDPEKAAKEFELEKRGKQRAAARQSGVVLSLL